MIRHKALAASGATFIFIKNHSVSLMKNRLLKEFQLREFFYRKYILVKTIFHMVCSYHNARNVPKITVLVIDETRPLPLPSLNVRLNCRRRDEERAPEFRKKAPQCRAIFGLTKLFLRMQKSGEVGGRFGKSRQFYKLPSSY